MAVYNATGLFRSYTLAQVTAMRDAAAALFIAGNRTITSATSGDVSTTKSWMLPWNEFMAEIEWWFDKNGGGGPRKTTRTRIRYV